MANGVQRFINCRVDFRLRNILDTISQQVEVNLILPKRTLALVAGRSILQNPGGPDSEAFFFAERPPEKVFDGETLIRQEISDVVNHS